MASRRQRFNARPEFVEDKRLVFAEFIKGVMDGTVRAERLFITPRGKTVDLDFDERPPRGQGGGRGPGPGP